MDMTSLLIQLISGAIGGNVAGALLKQFSLGTVGNSIAGILGGGIGGQLFSLLGAGGTGGGLDAGSLISGVLGSGVGGGVLMAIIGLVRQQMSKA